MKKKKFNTQKVSIIILIFLTISLFFTILFFYKQYKEIIPFYFKWETYHSEMGFKVSHPSNWYVNVDSPITLSITELTETPKRVKTKYGGYDLEKYPIVSISFYKSDWNYEELVANIIKDYQDVKRMTNIESEIMIEETFEVNNSRATLVKRYFQDKDGFMDNITHAALIVEKNKNNILLGSFQIVYDDIPNHQTKFYEKSIYKLINSIVID